MIDVSQVLCLSAIAQRARGEHLPYYVVNIRFKANRLV
jgi:hypothetical protein